LQIFTGDLDEFFIRFILMAAITVESGQVKLEKMVRKGLG